MSYKSGGKAQLIVEAKTVIDEKIKSRNNRKEGETRYIAEEMYLKKIL